MTTRKAKPKRPTNWPKADRATAELVFRAMAPGVYYTDDDIVLAVRELVASQLLFRRSGLSSGRIRHGRLRLLRDGAIRERSYRTYDLTTGRPRRVFTLRNVALISGYDAP